MTKYVVETVQVIRRKYYMKFKNNTRAAEFADECEIAAAVQDGVLEPFSSTDLYEDIVSMSRVKKWPIPDKKDNINGAVCKIDLGAGADAEWGVTARWDLA